MLGESKFQSSKPSIIMEDQGLTTMSCFKLFKIRAYVGDDENPQGIVELVYDDNIRLGLIYLNDNKGCDFFS